jgi:RNA polymerase sigma factor (sigma-70 family)
VSIVTEEASAAKQAFADWVRPHLPTMARLAARLAPAPDRDDVVQEALTRAWLNRHRYDDRRGTPSAWLLAITADQARKATSRRWSRPSFSALTERAAAIEPAAATERTVRPEDRVDLERALLQLTARQRLAIDCVYFVGLSISEAAAVMRCAEGTVKSTLADARNKLRVLLEVPE